MAIAVQTLGFVSIGGTDLSSFVKRATLKYDADMVETTAMGATTHVRLGGLKDWSVEIEWNQDHAAASVDATLFPLVGSTTTLILRPTNAAVSATNPNYTGTGILASYTPIQASVGELHTATTAFQAAGALSRATA